MVYYREVVLQNGKICTLRNAVGADGEAVLDTFLLTHAETDYLLSYPEENCITCLREKEFLEKKTASENEIEICAILDGRIVGTAGLEAVGDWIKNRHRAEFGIAIEKAYWGMGIGRALLQSCIECAKKAGYAQMELEVVSTNNAAIRLYTSVGFIEYGRNPWGARTKQGTWQEMLLMRLPLV